MNCYEIINRATEGMGMKACCDLSIMCLLNISLYTILDKNVAQNNEITSH